MKKRTEISKILSHPPLNAEVTVMGWVRAFRSNRFIALYDGSSAKTLQIVVDFEKFEEALLKKISFHACIAVTGKLVESQGAGQTVEVLAEEIEILGESNPELYPMQPKVQTMEFLREKAHFRMRTATFSSVFRIRHGVAYAIHKYYNDRGYYYLHAPIITGSDAEGAGEMFQVTTFDLMKPAYKNEDFDEIAEDFYRKIEKLIKQDSSENFRKILQLINKELPLVFEDYNFERLVTASSFEIEFLAKSIDYNNPLIKSLKRNFTKLYESLKAEIFEKGSKSSNFYFSKELSEKIMGVSFERDKKKRLIVQRQFSVERFPIFCFCFYNITSVQRRVKLSKKTRIDYEKDFFGKATNLTVSGQLQGEIAALALGKIYTFGPTFRAENSNTSRHLAEFWMIEPEVAFYDIEDNMDLAEDFVKYLINYVLENYPDDIAFLDQRIKDLEKNMKLEDRRPMGLVDTLRFVVGNDFERITYTDAVNLILNSKEYKKGKFEFELAWGKDLQAEHERWLVEKHFKKPVIVRNYPKDIKAFYMRLNEDGKTVAAMDVLFPGIGEVIGGSQREERYENLVQRIKAMGIHEEELWWYLELRKFGGAPHAGFGLGFERMVQFITGMGNIRDVIPFPRTPKSAEF